MRYSLLSRFRGTLAGVSVGSRLLRFNEKSVFPSVSGGEGDRYPQVGQNSNSYPEVEPKEKLRLTPQESLVLQMTRSLIRCRGWELADWNQSWEQWSKSRDLNSTSQVRSENGNRLFGSGVRCGDDPGIGEMVLAMVPLALLFHDQLDQLGEQLRQAIPPGKQSLRYPLREEAAAIGTAIALALREELDPPTLILKIRADLDPEIPLQGQLEQVQILTEQRACLETAREVLLKNSRESPEIPKTGGMSAASEGTIPVALAFYSFLTTPQHSAIALRRSAEIGRGDPIVGALTGALCGAYNGFSGFPRSWLLPLQTADSSAERSLGAELEEIWRSAAQLLAVWSGVYNPADPLGIIDPTLAVAAPNAIGSKTRPPLAGR